MIKHKQVLKENVNNLQCLILQILSNIYYAIIRLAAERYDVGNIRGDLLRWIILNIPILLFSEDLLYRLTCRISKMSHMMFIMKITGTP